MTIKVSKPAINIREELADLKQDTGIKGQELMRADTAQEVRSLIGAGRKNLIINGGFDVWQRGTSFSSVATGYTADRMRHANYSGATPTITKVGGTGNFLNAMKITGISTGQIEFEQRIESIGFPQSGNLTLSFWARGSKTGTIRSGRIINASTGATNTGCTTQDITTSWQKFSVTVTAIGATSSQYYRLFIGDSMLSYFDSSSVWLEITGVQLEVGSVATDFEHRSYGEELALCQRYYQTFQVSIEDYASGGGQYQNASIVYPVEMRTTPSKNYTGGTSSNSSIGVLFYNTTNKGCRCEIYSNGSGRFFLLGVNTTHDAEL